MLLDLAVLTILLPPITPTANNPNIMITIDNSMREKADGTTLFKALWTRKAKPNRFFFFFFVLEEGYGEYFKT
jgi:hypothetical protein